MRIKTLSTVILLLFAALTIGCGVTASVSATALTQPVMLGKIKRLHGTNNEQWQLRVSFDISISNRKFGGTGHLYDGCKANHLLLKLVETSHDKIVIDEVYIGSYSFLILSPGGGGEEEKSWADIKGGIYHAQEDAHETK